MCSAKDNCHSNPDFKVTIKCDGLFCSGNQNECLAGNCIQNSCSADKTCATHQTAIKDKCEGVMCISSDECVLDYDKNRTCFEGYCSKSAACSTSSKSSTSRCNNVECSQDSNCLSKKCNSGLCAAASKEWSQAAILGLVISLPLIIMVLIGGVVQYMRKNNRKLGLELERINSDMEKPMFNDQ